MTPDTGEPTIRLNREALGDFLMERFPIEAHPSLGTIVSVNLGWVRMKLEPLSSMMRPGGIVSGPSLMSLADVAAYAAIIAHYGSEATMAVTHSLSITFLRACKLEPVFADARLLKFGRRLATIDVRVWQEREDRLIAQATVGYALA